MLINNRIKSKRNILGSLRIFLGHVIAYFYEPSLKARSLKTIDESFRHAYPENRLTTNELKRLEEYQIDTIQLANRQAIFDQHLANNTVEATFYGSVIPLLKEIIKTDGNVKNVLNVGCSFDFVDFLLAKEFPEINFLGIDFPKNIAEFNKSFLTNNFKVVSGYALDFLLNTEQKFDIVYFSSTANNIKNSELHLYCKLINEKSRYILFNEPLWVFPDRMINLDDIDPHFSIPGHVYKDMIHDRFGYLSYNHNYRKIIELYNFSTIHYHTFHTDSAIQGTKLARIQLIGKRYD